jgi:hypothetical protein
MTVAMDDLRTYRAKMSWQDKVIRRCLAKEIPGEAAAELLREFQLLNDPAEKEAFVAVLATIVSIRNYPFASARTLAPSA